MTLSANAPNIRDTLNSSQRFAEEPTAQALGYRIDPLVLSSIRSASRKSGVSFGYMMAQAAQESGFNAQARATGSRATGLYQFIEQTWLGMVKQHGATHGLYNLASRIERDDRGNWQVADPALRQKILDLRTQPGIAAALGAALALDNKADLEANLDRPIGATELYLAHFLGAGGACRFLNAALSNGSQSAASLLPAAASANRAVFYDTDTGRARSVDEIYRMFRKSIESKSSAFACLEQGPAGTGQSFASSGIAGLRAGRRLDGSLTIPEVSSAYLMLVLRALDLPLKSLNNEAQDDGRENKKTVPSHVAAAAAYRKMSVALRGADRPW